jgi:hypothetical protein
MAIASKKTLEPKDIPVLGAPDDYRPTCTDFEQADSAQNQSPHDAFTDLGLCNEQSPQSLGWYHERFDWLLSVCVDECGPTGQLGKFAQEPAGPMSNDVCGRTCAVALGDLDFARKDDEEPLTHLADLGQRRASAKSANISETPEPFDFSRLQRWKHLVAPRLYSRRGVGSHARSPG